jgi:hypothetical protein
LEKLKLLKEDYFIDNTQTSDMEFNFITKTIYF